jgi:hypothetical protein
MDKQLVRSAGTGPEGPRKIVAAHLSAWSGLSYDWRAQVVVTVRGDSLAAVREVLVQPGDDVVTILPSDAALRRPWHRRTKAVVVPWLAAGSPVWAGIAIACLRADAWLILDARGMSTEQPDGSHPAALPGMARRTITVGSMCAGQLGWIVGPKRIISAIAHTRDRPVSLPAA